MVRSPWLRLLVAVCAVAVITTLVSIMVIGTASATETAAGATQPPSVRDWSTGGPNGCESPGSGLPWWLIFAVPGGAMAVGLLLGFVGRVDR